MFHTRQLLVLLVCLAAAGSAAGEPVITSRSIVNGVTFGDGPGVVPRGGILAIVGEALAAEQVDAETVPLPTSLGDPAVQVLINGVAAPLFFVSPTQINAQIPWETEAGRAEIVVRQGETDSAAIDFIVANINVSLFRHSGTSAPIAESWAPSTDPAAASSAPIGLGGPAEPPAATGTVLEPDATISVGSVLRVFAAGIGDTEPALESGSAGAQDTTYEFAEAQRAFLGGIPVVEPSFGPSTELVGVYDMTFTVPDLAGSTEVFRWVSGGGGASGVMGPVGAPVARYMAVPEGVTSAEVIQMTDLNPYYVALGGDLDVDQGCYPGVHVLDFRRETTTAISDCVFPSFPNNPNPAQYRPFEAATNSGVLAAMIAPETAPAAGLSDQLLLVDSAAGTTETVAIADGADRLQIGLGNSATLRLLRPESDSVASANAVVDLSGAVVDDAPAFAELPDEVDGLSVILAQGNANFIGGYRVRILGPASADDGVRPHAILFDGDANVVTKVAIPDGWDPIAPPRRQNPRGEFQGGPSLAPATGGFAGVPASFVGIRKTDGTQDGLMAVQLTLPDPDDTTAAAAGDGESQPTATMTLAAIEFGSGVYAANCVTQVRWLRIPATRTIAIVGSGEALTEFGEPRDGGICAGDRLVLFDTLAQEVRQVMVGEGEKLDVWLKGASNSYLYFGDGTREVPYQASTKIHVFDGTSETFRQIEFPSNAAEPPAAIGIPYNNQLTQSVDGQSLIVALATSGPPRTNNQGVQVQPFPGNEGLLAVDLEAGTSTVLALPEGFQRVELGSGAGQLAQQGRRPFGLIPLIGRAFANARRPGQPPSTRIVTWDMASGDATVVALPEDAHFTVRPLGGGLAQAPFLWDLKMPSASFAFGVYNQGRELIGVAVVGPEMAVPDEPAMEQ